MYEIIVIISVLAFCMVIIGMLAFCIVIISSTKEKEQRLISSESGYCVRVEKYFYPRTILSVNRHYNNTTTRLGQVQSGHHFIDYNICHDISVTLLTGCQTTNTHPSVLSNTTEDL